MNLALLAVPAITTLVGMIGVVIAAARTAEEAARLRLELARVSDLRPAAQALLADARTLQANRRGRPSR